MERHHGTHFATALPRWPGWSRSLPGLQSSMRIFPKKRATDFFMGPEIALRNLEKRQPSTGIRRGGIDSETAVSSRVGFMRHQMATVRATAWPPVVHLSMTQLPECGKLLMPNDALKVQ